MGKREPMQTLTALRKLWGQVSAGPSAVRDQSSARIRSPISPPPASQVAEALFLASGWSIFLVDQFAEGHPTGMSPAR
jgi:hypothetical protein